MTGIWRQSPTKWRKVQRNYNGNSLAANSTWQKFPFECIKSQTNIHDRGPKQSFQISRLQRWDCINPPHSFFSNSKSEATIFIGGKFSLYYLQPLLTTFQPNVNPVPTIAETVINLLNYQLSKTEFNVSNEGLTFILTPIISHIHQFG